MGRSVSMSSRSIGCGALSTRSPASLVSERHLTNSGIPLGGKTSSVSPTKKRLRWVMMAVVSLLCSSPDGTLLASPCKGINIVTTTLPDGTRQSRKVMY